jgi:hypothetical protein
MLNETRIPGQRVPLAEDEGGTPTREWFRYFEYLYTVAASSVTNAAFYDITSTAWTANTPTIVPVGLTYAAHGFALSASRVTVAGAGRCIINASLQLTNNNASSDDDMTIWLQVNSADATATARRVTVPKQHAGVAGSVLMTVNFSYTFAAGDYFELYGLSKLGYAQIATYAASSSPAYPAAPGTILSVAQIL